MALNNHICVLQGEAISVHCVSMIMRFSRLVTASFWFFCHSGFSHVTSHTVFHILYKHHCVERYDKVILSWFWILLISPLWPHYQERWGLIKLMSNLKLLTSPCQSYWGYSNILFDKSKDSSSGWLNLYKTHPTALHPAAVDTLNSKHSNRVNLHAVVAVTRVTLCSYTNPIISMLKKKHTRRWFSLLRPSRPVSSTIDC